MNNRFYIELDNKELYLMEVNFNFDVYRIKKGYLYKKHKKLGKIVKIFEENESIVKITKEDYAVLKSCKDGVLSKMVKPILREIAFTQRCGYPSAELILKSVEKFDCKSAVFPIHNTTEYRLIFEVENK